MKRYMLTLPVFKQGDDLAKAVEDSGGNIKVAFEQCAKQYDSAAKLCRDIAVLADERVIIGIDAGAHCIHLKRVVINGIGDARSIYLDDDKGRLAQLVKDGVVHEEEIEGDEVDEPEELAQLRSSLRTIPRADYVAPFIASPLWKKLPPCDSSIMEVDVDGKRDIRLCQYLGMLVHGEVTQAPSLVSRASTTKACCRRRSAANDACIYGQASAR